MINIKADVESEFYIDEFVTNYEENFESEVICNKSL